MRAALVSAALLLGGCHSVLPGSTSFLGHRTDAAHPATYNGLALKSGQIVLTESPEPTSFAFSLVPEHFHPFTHGAILSMEGGEPYVYEASGAVVTFPLHKRVLDNVSGTVHRRKLIEYVAPNLYAEVVDLPVGVDGEKVAAYARSAYERHAEFDAFFDYRDHEKLFCTELVELALEAGGAAPTKLDGVRDNASLKLAVRWLGAPTAGALAAGQYYEPERFVAALGQFRSRTAAFAYFAAKRELHRRFQQSQRLGFLFELQPRGILELRPDVTRFAYESSHLFDAFETPPPPGDPRIDDEVRRFADATFGPVP